MLASELFIKKNYGYRLKLFLSVRSQIIIMGDSAVCRFYTDFHFVASNY